MNLAEYILKYLATPAVFIAVFAWLCKEIVLQIIKTQSALVLEKSKLEVQKTLDELRYQLNRDIEDFKTRFSHLQERRFEPLLKLYSSISELCSQASLVYINSTYYSNEEIESDYIDKLEDLIGKARQEYFNVRLFLPDSIAIKAKSLIENIAKAEMDYYVDLKGGSCEKIKAQKIFQTVLHPDYENELENLSKDIRSLLGVENNDLI